MPILVDELVTARRSRVQWTQVQGIPVLALDFNAATAAETLEMLVQFKRAAEGQSPASLRLLTDVRGINYDAGVSAKWKAARMEADPLVRASAIYGVSGLVGSAIRSYIELMKWLKLPHANRKMRVFKTKEQAIEWLIST